MKRTIVRLAIAVAVFLTLAFVVVLVNQVAQFSLLMGALHPVAGRVTLVTLIAALVAAGVVPIVMFVRLPKPLVPPLTADGPEYERYLARLHRRLASNQIVAGQPLATVGEIKGALGKLAGEADIQTKRAAAKTFLTTAVSQNGTLDGFVVLWIQLQLVWDIAHIYYQRPTLRDLAFLYTNVMGAAVLATRLDSVDLSERVRPIVSNLMGSTIANLPGVQSFGGMIANSTVTGAANALVTLQIGYAASSYCAPLVRPSREGVWKTSMAKASEAVGGIMMRGASSLTGAFLKASGQNVANAAAGTINSVAGVGR